MFFAGIFFLIAASIAIGMPILLYGLVEEGMSSFAAVAFAALGILFFVLMVLGGVGGLRAFRARKRALTTKPVDAEIQVIRSEVRNNQDNYFVEIKVKELTWSAILQQSRKIDSLVGEAYTGEAEVGKPKKVRGPLIAGKAWIDPLSGKPVIAEAKGVRIVPVPVITLKK